MSDDGAVVVVGGTRAIGLELVRHYAEHGTPGRPHRPVSRARGRRRRRASAAPCAG